jgi:hypothetical protein
VRPEQGNHDFKVGQANAAAAAKPSGFLAIEQEQGEALVVSFQIFRLAGDFLVLPRHRLANDEF